MYSENKIDKLREEVPVLRDIMDLEPVVWLNPNKKTMAEMPSCSIKGLEIFAAEKLWDRFAPFFIKAIPETAETNGILESPLREIPEMKSLLNQDSPKISGRLMLKCDNALPIAGSIKASGGFYEVLH